MKKKKLLIYLFIFLSVDSSLILNIDNIINFKNSFNTDGTFIEDKEKLQVKLLSTFTIDSSWIIIDTTTTTSASLDDVINNYISLGKTKFFIKDGVYNLNNSIKVNSQNVIIYGESKENTKIVQGNTGNNTIEVTADNAQISNLTIDNKQGEIAFTSKDCNNVILEDCIIYGSPSNSAIAFWGTTGVNDINAVENNNLTSGNIIQGNTIYSHPSGTLDGLVFMKQKNGTIKNNKMIGSRIAFYLCRNSEVSSNIIKDSNDNGIRFTVPAYDNKILNNTIDNTLASGICVVRNDKGATPSTYRATNTIISNNTITNSRYFGIEVSNLKDSFITNNVIDRIDFDGIYLLYDDSLTVTSNKIYNTGLTTSTNPTTPLLWNKNLNSGIFLDSEVCNSYLDYNEITNNYDSSLYGIKIQSGGTNLSNFIRHNTITGNFSTGIDANVGSPEYTTISDNIINLNSTPAPANINIVSAVDNISLNWDAVAGVTEYEIEQDGAIIAKVSNTNYLSTSLTSNTNYKYRVRAVGGNWSNPVSATTLPPQTPVILPAPTNINAVSSVDNIKLNWDSVSGATEYEIEQDGNIIDKVSSTNYLSTGLTSSTNYNYRVRAVGGDWCNVVIATTLPASSTPPSPVILPAPTNINTVPSVDNINLTWDPVAGATEYEIEQDGNIIDKVSITNYLSTGLTSSTNYNYRVRAVGGDWCNVITATTLPASSTPPSPVTLPAPTNINTVPSVDNINLTWDPVAGATEYEIEQDGNIIDKTSSANYVDDGLISNHSYKYRIRAVGGNWSNLVTTTTLPASPTNTTTGSSIIVAPAPNNITTVSSIDKITITWDAVPSATGYEIEADGKIISAGTKKRYVHTGLISNSKHKYSVRAIGGTWSKIITAKTSPVSPPAIISAPTNIITVPSIDKITITWNAVPGATGYEIEADGKILWIGTEKKYIHTGLISNNTYKYRVRAIGGAWSKFITVKTLPDSSSPQNPAIIPAPTNITTVSLVDKITITWNEVPDAAGYEIEANGNIISTGTAKKYIHTGLISNNTYKYRVRAIDGTWSKFITAKTLPDSSPPQNPAVIPAPTNITTVSSVYKITITWNAVPDAAGYEIDVNGKIINTGTIKKYVHTGLISDNKYNYRVRAIGGAWSKFITAKTLPASSPSQNPDPIHTSTNGNKSSSTVTIPAPTNITTVSSVNNIKISWNPVEAASGYEIEVDGNIINVGTRITYLNTGLISNSSHNYRVRAIGGYWSDIVTVVTLSIPSPPPQVIIPTPAKTNMLSFVDNIKTNLEPVVDVAKYEMDDLKDIPQLPEATVISQATSNSKPENSISLEKPSSDLNASVLIPTNIKATPQFDSITISWDEVVGASGYEIDVDGKVIDNGNNTSYTDVELTSDTTHSYRVRIKGLEWSEILNVKTLSQNDMEQNKDNNIAKSNSDISNLMKSIRNNKFFTIVATLLLICGIALKRVLKP